MQILNSIIYFLGRKLNKDKSKSLTYRNNIYIAIITYQILHICLPISEWYHPAVFYPSQAQKGKI